MKMKTLAMLAGVGAPLIATAAAPAEFLGITVQGKTNAFGLIVCNIYANFDNTGDIFQAVAGTALAPMLIQVEGGGTFYNHAFGTDRAPGDALIAAFNSLAFDTFVTIGIKSTNDNLADALVITPGFPTGITGTQLSTDESGWAVTPIDPQGEPFNPDYVGGNGSILIGQFSTADGTGISGTMLIQWAPGVGKAESVVVSFFHVPTPGALALLGTAGLIGARRRRRS
jgi:hypothetical protein